MLLKFITFPSRSETDAKPQPSAGPLAIHERMDLGGQVGNVKQTGFQRVVNSGSPKTCLPLNTPN